MSTTSSVTLRRVRTIYRSVTVDQFTVAASFPRETVLRDDSGTVWVNLGFLSWQRPGSHQHYGPEAFVWPVTVLWQPDLPGMPIVNGVSVTWQVTQELYGFPHAAGPELDRLIAGPAGSTLIAMEAALAAGALATEARVHIITGFLKASGTVRSHASADGWDGEIDYAGDPGIFELWRGNTPTRHHPSGGHYFFDPGGPDFERGVRQAVWDYVTDGQGGPAPAEGLGPWSGG
jgi:hypothetical protein